MNARVLAIEYSLPNQIITNGDLKKTQPEWDLEKIAPRTGVLERRHCDQSETALDLGARASRKLIENHPISAEDIDILIFCSQSADHIIPGNATLLHQELGLRPNVPAFDYTLACSGFVYGLWMAQSFIANGTIKNILLVTADSYSRYLHPDDRSTITLFGDAGAAALIQRQETASGGIGQFELGTDGGKSQTFWIKAGGARHPKTAETATPYTDRGGSISSDEHIYMDGPGVLAFVRKRVPRAVKELLTKSDLSLDDIDLVICHQASALSLEFVQKWLKVPDEKFFTNIEKIGNTVSASIPIALKDAEEAGALKRGNRVLLVGFGAGLSWGICTIDW